MRGLTWVGVAVAAGLALAECHKQPAAAPTLLAAPSTPASVGTPPAPSGDPPPPAQLAAVKATLAGCGQSAAAPGAEALAPCMYDHGWVLKMTLDCHYGGDPANAACYVPRS